MKFMTHTRTALPAILLLTALSFGGCQIEDPDPCEDLVCLNGGACQTGTCICPEGFGGTNCEVTLSTTGTALFWTSEPLTYGVINVTVNGITKTIQSSTGSTYPTCENSSDNPTWELEEGEYMYEANDSQRSWNGTVSIDYAGDCASMQLVAQNPVIKTITYYTKNSSYLPITVTLTGTGILGGSETHTITQAFPAGITSCDVQGCANFLVMQGTVTLSASSSAGNWYQASVVTTTACTMTSLD